MDMEAALLQAAIPEGKLIVRNPLALNGLAGVAELTGPGGAGPGFLRMGPARRYGAAEPPGAFALLAAEPVAVRDTDAVLLLPEDYGLPRLREELAAVFLRQERRQRLCRDMEQAALFGSLSELLQSASLALEADAALYDSLGQPLAAAPAGPRARLSDEELAGARRIELDGETVAYLLLGESALPEPLRAPALAHATRLIQAALRRRESEAPGRKFSTELLLLQLVGGEPIPEAALRFRAGLCGWETEGCFALMLADLRDRPASKRSTAALLDRIESMSGASPLLSDGLLTLFFPLKSPEELPRRSQIAGRCLAGAGYRGVYGRVFGSLTEVKDAYDRLREALELAGPDGGAVSFDRLEPAYLARRGGYTAPRHLHPLCRRLLELDEHGKFRYSETVLQYLRCAQRPAETCAALGIHRNTLDYRLRRIEEQCGLDFGDGEQMFRLMFSLLAAEGMEEAPLPAVRSRQSG